jgi:hypothetical protein
METMNERSLARWETWPLWALGLSNGANLCLWYVTSMMDVTTKGLVIVVPAYVATFLPHIVILGGLAAAGSLDGVLVATLAGVRQGRQGAWTWATLISAAAFSALISYALHAGRIADWPWLHCAMMAVMLPYNFHLSQPRKALHDTETTKSVNDRPTEPMSFGRCKKCGSTHARLVDYRLCKGSIDNHWPESQTDEPVSQGLPNSKQRAEAPKHAHRDGV